jgi:hypothetical protein
MRGPTDLTLPDSYAYDTTRYTIENYLSTYQSDTDAPKYMHGKDIIQSSWTSIGTTEGLNLDLYCLTCAVQGDRNSHACLGSIEACFTEVWIDAGIAREGTESDIEMPIGNDGRKVEYNSQDPSIKIHPHPQPRLCVRFANATR